MNRKLISPRIFTPLVLVLMAGSFAFDSSNLAAGEPGDQPACKTAQEVIERNLAALGGEERLRAVKAMTIKGTTGSALLTGGQDVTLYLQKPDMMKQEGLFQIYLYDGWRVIFNNGGSKSALAGTDLEEYRYRLGFYHNCFSLLKWEESFPSAVLEGVKRYGPARQYVVGFPGAENGHDLLAYIDAGTFLVDRISFTVNHPEAKGLKVVNRLRNYKEFGGILMPTRLVYDKIGWEEGPSHFVIDEIEINPEQEEGLFESCDIDFGSVVCEGNTVRGEIRGAMESYLLTNIRIEDLRSIGAELKDWLLLEVGDFSMKVRFLDNIQAAAKEIRPNEVYICRYPISGYMRMILMGFGVEVLSEIPWKEGGALVLTRLEEDASPAAEEEDG